MDTNQITQINSQQLQDALRALVDVTELVDGKPNDEKLGQLFSSSELLKERDYKLLKKIHEISNALLSVVEVVA